MALLDAWSLASALRTGDVTSASKAYASARRIVAGLVSGMLAVPPRDLKY